VGSVDILYFCFFISFYTVAFAPAFAFLGVLWDIYPLPSRTEPRNELDEWKRAKRNGRVGDVGDLRADKGREVDRWLRPPFEERGFLCSDVQVEAKKPCSAGVMKSESPAVAFRGHAQYGHVSIVVGRPPPPSTSW
jgi:hypothetical protein